MSSAPRRPATGESFAATQDARRTRSRTTLVVLGLCGVLLFAGFIGLGTWQVHRLHWKLDLIARVHRRVHAPPVTAPGPQHWPQVTAESDEYRHVRLSGTLLYDLTTPVQAVTDLGSGFWLLTPLREADGSVVLVNRGFVPTDAVDIATGKLRQPEPAASAAAVSVTGLLRISEPGGAFLHHNDPGHNRWYSRDVQAIARARGLHDVAPYFVDEDAGQPPANRADAGGAPSQPVGGLTVIAFHNSHLVYAFTWYGLALMTAVAGFWLAREEYRLRRRPGTGADRIEQTGEHGEQS